MYIQVIWIYTYQISVVCKFCWGYLLEKCTGFKRSNIVT